jgi:hypothetical protein
MKTLFIVALVVVAMFLGHNYLQTGEIGFGNNLSDVEREIRSLDERLTDGMRAFRVAGRGASIGGVADTSSGDAAIRTVRDVEREIRELKRKVNSDREEERMAALETRLAEAKRVVGLN